VPAHFHFKQFVIHQQHAAMKVGTDSVLLGSLVKCGEAVRVLDIGTGTGLLALMVAQKSKALIDAIEIDEFTCREAAENFNGSPWADRLSILHAAFPPANPVDYGPYDLIITNPPYYRREANIRITDRQRAKARHDMDLSFEVLAAGANSALAPGGKLWLILPVKEALDFINICRGEGLHLQRSTMIRPKPRKTPNRTVLCLGREEMKVHEEELTIYNEDGSPTHDYVKLTKDYLLWEGR
jgi:tRNA1Val (adenine37-N6)-methyltransferase